MNKFLVTGMSCAACQARVEKAVAKVPGVESVSVSLLTNSMKIEGNADNIEIIEAVERAGYGVEIIDIQSGQSQSLNYDEEMLKDTETPKLRSRLAASLVILVPLMYLSMGHMMWGWPLPDVLSDNHIAIGLLQLLLTMCVLIINQKFFISGVTSVLHGVPNMDTLVALGAGAAFGYSTYVLFAMTHAQIAGEHDKIMEYMHDLYFESAAMIVTLITVGKMLEAYSKGKTTNALKSLMKLAPKTAVVIQKDDAGNEVEKVISIEQLKKGDIFVVRPGESIPVDGVVLEGNGAVDESALTGESIPVDKSEGMKVSSATMNQSGFLKCEATGVGEDTTLSQIIQMVSDAATDKAPIAKAADRISGIFVPVVMIIAVLTIVIWLFAGQTVGFALARGISVLVISCPCALGLATPVAIMVGNGVGAKNGILFKNASAIENAGKAEVIALDKTGTITEGRPKVTDIITDDGISIDEMLNIVYSLEIRSEHPLAKAVVAYAEEKSIKALEVTDFKAVTGNGLWAILNGKKIFGGNIKYIESMAEIPIQMRIKSEELSNQGKTPLFFAHDKKMLGIIAVADVIKEESPNAIKELENMGIEVIMITGDNEKTARAIGCQVGVDNIVAEVLPQGKDKEIQKLAGRGMVAMVGDGINDAPALTRADIGIAIGAGTDIAIDAADVVLMKSRLSDVSAAIRLSRAVLKNIHENLFWAFIYNIIGIPLAAGLWYPILGLKLNPMFGAAAMSLSSFCVVANALRLNWFDVYSSVKDKKRNRRIKESKRMEKIMGITGMMCGHCEARVKKVLEELPEVDEAIVSHEKNQAVVKLNAEIADTKLKEIVEAEEYIVEYIK